MVWLHLFLTQKNPTNVGSDYHLTINTKRCLYFPSYLSKLQSGLIWGFTFVRTNWFHTSTLQEDGMRHRASKLLHEKIANNQHPIAPLSPCKYLLEGQKISHWYHCNTIIESTYIVQSSSPWHILFSSACNLRRNFSAGHGVIISIILMKCVILFSTYDASVGLR
jgi:hypothetical protein